MKCMKHILILLLVLFIAVAMEAQENYNPKRTLKEVKAQLKADIYYRFIGMLSPEDPLVLQRKKGYKG